MKQKIFLSILLTALVIGLYAQNEQYRPNLFFREDWTQFPQKSQIPLSQKHVANSNLTIHLYGAGKDSLSKSHHSKPFDDPHYVWSGKAHNNWMVTLKHKTQNVDLSGYAKIVWRSKQSGFRVLRIVLKLANGTWLISKQGDTNSNDWRIREFNLSDISWYLLDAKKVCEIAPFVNPDLSNVEEIGFTDLMIGGSSHACSRLDWIEVYGEIVIPNEPLTD